MYMYRDPIRDPMMRLASLTDSSTYYLEASTTRLTCACYPVGARLEHNWYHPLVSSFTHLRPYPRGTIVLYNCIQVRVRFNPFFDLT